MRTLSELVDYAEKAEVEFDFMRDDESADLWGSIAKYLREYRDCRRLLYDDRVVSYWGRLPVIQLGKKYFAVRNYVAKHKAWRCHHVEWDKQTGEWYCNDDDNYIIDKHGILICREVGWDLKEVYHAAGNA